MLLGVMVAMIILNRDAAVGGGGGHVLSSLTSVLLLMAVVVMVIVGRFTEDTLASAAWETTSVTRWGRRGGCPDAHT